LAASKDVCAVIVAKLDKEIIRIANLLVLISLTFRILQNWVQYTLTAVFSHSNYHLLDEPELRELDAPELRLGALLELLRLGALTLLLLRLGALTLLLLRLLLELELELRLVLALELRLELVLELLRVALLLELLLRLELEVAELLRLELALELLRVELEVAELLRLLLVVLLRSLLTLREVEALLSVRLGLVLLGRSYVVPD
jgi:hypothetical protein